LNQSQPILFLVTKWQKSITKKTLVITCSFTSILSKAILISSYYLHIRLGILMFFFNYLVLRRHITSHIYAKLCNLVILHFNMN
jgi:hypothetical protein